MLKTAGCILLFVCSFVYGRLLAGRVKRQLIITEALCSFVMHVGGNIRASRMPLGEIYGSFHSQVLEECGFMSALRAEGLCRGVDLLAGILSEEAGNALSSLAGRLGGDDAERQAALCDFTEKKLRAELESLREACDGRVRMYSALPVLAALSLIIIIL